jgi:GcrA cell cycle regulator
MSLTYLENRHNLFTTPWTADQVERLKILWADGYSASQIANELKGARFTRMSVIGKVHRLKLPARNPRQPAQRKPYTRANGIPKPPVPPPRPKPPPPPPPPGTAPKMRQLTFAKLGPRHCHWPLGELIDPPRLFCGADADKGEVYCPVHMRAARVRRKDDG